jgi:hypothetical protein
MIIFTKCTKNLSSMCFNDGIFVSCEIKTNWSLRRVLVELKSKTKLYKYALILISKKIQYLKKLQMLRRIISMQEMSVVMAILWRDCNLNPNTNCIQASRSTIFKTCYESPQTNWVNGKNNDKKIKSSQIQE